MTSSNRRLVRVLCADNQSERYDGQYWFEKIDSINELNGSKVDGKKLNVQDLKNGDKIKYLFSGREWNGTVAKEDKETGDNINLPQENLCKRKGDEVEKPPKKRKVRGGDGSILSIKSGGGTIRSDVTGPHSSQLQTVPTVMEVPPAKRIPQVCENLPIIQMANLPLTAGSSGPPSGQQGKHIPIPQVSAVLLPTVSSGYPSDQLAGHLPEYQMSNVGTKSGVDVPFQLNSPAHQEPVVPISPGSRHETVARQLFKSDRGSESLLKAYVDQTVENATGDIASVLKLQLDQQKSQASLLNALTQSIQSSTSIQKQMLEQGQSSTSIQKQMLEQGEKLLSQGEILLSHLNNVVKEQQHLRSKQDQMMRKQDQLFSRLAQEIHMRALPTPVSSPVSAPPLHPRTFRPLNSPSVPFRSPPLPRIAKLSPTHHFRHASCPPVISATEEAQIAELCDSIGDIDSELSFVSDSHTSAQPYRPGGSRDVLDMPNQNVTNYVYSLPNPSQMLTPSDTSSGFPSQSTGAGLVQDGNPPPNQSQMLTPSDTSSGFPSRNTGTCQVNDLVNYGKPLSKSEQMLTPSDLSGGFAGTSHTSSVVGQGSLTESDFGADPFSEAFDATMQQALPPDEMNTPSPMPGIKQPLKPKRLLRDSAVVLGENVHLHQPTKLRSLAVVLCRESFFGDEVLSQSTVTGRRFYPLCPNKLRNLKEIIRRVADPNLQQTDDQFEHYVWKGVATAIGEYCKRLRSHMRSSEGKLKV